jgi:hypothetical protein
MAQDPREVGAERLEDDQDKSAEQLRAEIEETREGLGDTVEALAAKTDVKTRAREKADELKRSAIAKKDELVGRAKQAKAGSGTGQDAGVAATGTPAGLPAEPADSGGAGSVGERLKHTAQENPVPAAALAAFVGGIAFDRLIRR